MQYKVEMSSKLYDTSSCFFGKKFGKYKEKILNFAVTNPPAAEFWLL